MRKCRQTCLPHSKFDLSYNSVYDLNYKEHEDDGCQLSIINKCAIKSK